MLNKCSAHRTLHLRVDFVQTRSLDRSQYWGCHLRRRNNHGLSVYANIHCGRLPQICCFSSRFSSCSPVLGRLRLPSFCTVPLFGTALRLGQFAAWIHRHCDRDSISVLALEVWSKPKGEKHICGRVRRNQATSSETICPLATDFKFQTLSGSAIPLLCEVSVLWQNGSISCESKRAIRLDS
jgi:hypothetical protein